MHRYSCGTQIQHPSMYLCQLTHLNDSVEETTSSSCSRSNIGSAGWCQNNIISKPHASSRIWQIPILLFLWLIQESRKFPPTKINYDAHAYHSVHLGQAWLGSTKEMAHDKELCPPASVHDLKVYYPSVTLAVSSPTKVRSVSRGGLVMKACLDCLRHAVLEHDKQCLHHPPRMYVATTW